MATATAHPNKSTAHPNKLTSKQSATVRISEQSRVKLRELAAQSGEPMQAILDKALEHYRRQKFLEECETAYATLQGDPEAWKEYQEELKSFEGTLMDGLNPNEDWSSLQILQPTERNREKHLA